MSNSVTDSGRFYSRAAKDRVAARPSCCAASTALAAGYEQQALDKLPADVVDTSFGCGDPVAFAAVEEGQTVLDLGCGAGLDLVLAAQKVGPTGMIIGVDASEDMLALAERNVAQAGLSERVDLRLGQIERLPVDDRSVDWVISNCVINLSTEKHNVFREIRRVLKPGGSAVISDLVAEGLPDWVHAHSDLYSACVSGAVSEQRYLELAQDAGFAEPRVTARMQYDESLVRGLLTEALPIDLDAVADALGLSRAALLDMASRELAGCISSVRFCFTAG